MKTINRKDFLKSLGLAGVTAVAAPILIHCNNDDDDDNGSNPDGDSSTSGCSVTNPETAGPYPTNSPSSLVRTDITGDRTGVALDITFTIQNVDASCAALQGAIVDVWHCDKDGNYSEYGSFASNSTHFLRGRQVADSNGQVNFTTIFPGWYNGRATHLHVHIYSSTGQSLLVTQVAFPEGNSSAVVLVNAATSYGYTKGMSGYTYNANDGIFSDGYTNELCTISGSLSAGYTMTHIIRVSV